MMAVVNVNVAIDPASIILQTFTQPTLLIVFTEPKRTLFHLVMTTNKRRTELVLWTTVRLAGSSAVS